MGNLGIRGGLIGAFDRTGSYISYAVIMKNDNLNNLRLAESDVTPEQASKCIMRNTNMDLAFALTLLERSFPLTRL